MTSEHTLFSRSPELYQQYEREEILQSNLVPWQIFQEGQLYSGVGEKALFLDISTAKIISSDTIRISQPPTLSDKLIAFDSTQRNITLDLNHTYDLYVFARSQQDALYTFIGYVKYIAIEHGLQFVEIDFVLTKAFPESVEISLKGYKWKVYDTVAYSHVKNALLYTFDADDAIKFAHKMLGRHGDLTIDRFDGQQLLIHLLHERAYMTYSIYKINSRIHKLARDPLVQNSDVMLVDPYPDVEDTIPLSMTIPRDNAIKALEEFINTGQRPTCVKWQD